MSYLIYSKKIWNKNNLKVLKKKIKGTANLIRLSGFGGIEPNTVLLNYYAQFNDDNKGSIIETNAKTTIIDTLNSFEESNINYKLSKFDYVELIKDGISLYLYIYIYIYLYICNKYSH